MEHDILIIRGGIIALPIARAVGLSFPDAGIALGEKEGSSRN